MMTEAASGRILREELIALLDEFGVVDLFTWTGDGEPVRDIAQDPMKRLRNMLETQTSPANKGAFVCVQLLNALRTLRSHLQSTCESRGAEHKPQCGCWQADFWISAYQRGFFPKDAEIWMRTLSVVQAIQTGRRRGTMVGLTQVPEIPLDELVHLANGHPAAVTDAYAQMESLRTVVQKMKEHVAQSKRGGTKAARARQQGVREVLKKWLPHLEEIVDAQATDICAGLIETFGAWLTTQKEPITVGRKQSAAGIARAVDEFVTGSHLRRRPKVDEKGQGQ